MTSQDKKRTLYAVIACFGLFILYLLLKKQGIILQTTSGDGNTAGSVVSPLNEYMINIPPYSAGNFEIPAFNMGGISIVDNSVQKAGYTPCNICATQQVNVDPPTRPTVVNNYYPAPVPVQATTRPINFITQPAARYSGTYNGTTNSAGIGTYNGFYDFR